MHSAWMDHTKSRQTGMAWQEAGFCQLPRSSSKSRLELYPRPRCISGWLYKNDGEHGRPPSWRENHLPLDYGKREGRWLLPKQHFVRLYFGCTIRLCTKGCGGINCEWNGSRKVVNPERCAGVDTIEPASIRWSTIRFQRSNQSYRMLISLCQFIFGRYASNYRPRWV